MSKTALITGFTGQDGTFLTSLLLSKGYRVIGLCRRVSTEPPQRVRGDMDFSAYKDTGQLVTVIGDLSSVRSLVSLMSQFRPDEVYNLAAQSHVGISFTQPEYTFEVNYTGLLNIITALEVMGLAETTKLYQASTSEMFGDLKAEVPINELQPFNPNSPYAISKTAAHYQIRAERSRGRFATAGILFNHESEIRGGDFVTQKIARGVAEFPDAPDNGLGVEAIRLGNLESRRDWGYAGDYVRAMYAMMQTDTPSEYIVGTGEVHSVREFVEAAFKVRGKEIKWDKNGYADNTAIYEVGRVEGHIAVMVDPKFYRPLDVGFLQADPTRANLELDWKPNVSFEDLVSAMVDYQRRIRT